MSSPSVQMPMISFGTKQAQRRPRRKYESMPKAACLEGERKRQGDQNGWNSTEDERDVHVALYVVLMSPVLACSFAYVKTDIWHTTGILLMASSMTTDGREKTERQEEQAFSEEEPTVRDMLHRNTTRGSLNSAIHSRASAYELSLFNGRCVKDFRKWRLWGSNPRPFGLAPEASALDQLAKPNRNMTTQAEQSRRPTQAAQYANTAIPNSLQHAVGHNRELTSARMKVKSRRTVRPRTRNRQASGIKVTAGIPVVRCRFLGRYPPVLGLVALAGSARLT